MNVLKRTISLFLVLFLLMPLQAYDRYGRSTKSKSKSGDGFSYFWRSLLIPGWGEYKLGYKKQAAVFLLTDVFMIGAAAGLNYYSGVRTDEYMDFAEMYAGVNTSGKSDSYWIHISNYDNTLEFNEQRNIDRYYSERYTDEEDFWDWTSDDKREKYNDIRISAENADTWFYYTIGGIALNHFISALNASGKASAVKAQVLQSFDKEGNIKNKLQLTYDF